MWRILFITTSLLGAAFNVLAQEARYYRVVENNNVEAVNFTLTATLGSCTIKPTKSRHPINIFGNPENEHVIPTFDTWMSNGIQQVSFNLEHNQPLGIRRKFAYSVFNNETTVEENKWHIYLSEDTPMFLNLNYGIGKAEVDLSDMTIKQLKMNTGNADVTVSYAPGKMNRVEMDTFMVTVDMGSLKIEEVNLSRAKVVIAEVGFGSLNLDLGEKNIMSNRITASVGAGSLFVSLPQNEIPIIVYINNSPLCRILLGKDFQQIKPNVYANQSYKEDAQNLLTFDLDVAMGKISFVKK